MCPDSVHIGLAVRCDIDAIGSQARDHRCIHGVRRAEIIKEKRPGLREAAAAIAPDVLVALNVRVDGGAPLGTFAHQAEIHRQGRPLGSETGMQFRRCRPGYGRRFGILWS